MQPLPLTWEVPNREQVLQVVDAFLRWYRDNIRIMSSAASSFNLECPNKFQVEDLSLKEIAVKIQDFKNDIAEGKELNLILRARSNMIFSGNRILLKDQGVRYKPRNRKKDIILGLLDLILMFYNGHKRYTLRSLYYLDTKLFEQQAVSDSALDDICCIIGCSRSSLNVFASDRGYVGGVLTFRLNDHQFNCRRMGPYGQPIPPFIDDQLNDVETHGALFILYMEKHTAYVSLMEDKFYLDYPCIIITGMRIPYVATRRFINFLSITFELPTFAIVDSDPYGFQILSTCVVGFEAMCYDNEKLVTPSIIWLGLLPTDVEGLEMPSQNMSIHDIDKIHNLMKKDYVKSHNVWLEELNYMCQTKKVANIDALNRFGVHTLAKALLAYKLNLLKVID